MKKLYITSTFSPMMLGPHSTAKVWELKDDHPRFVIENFERNGAKVVSAVSHEVTADILSKLIEYPVKFDRVNISLVPGDTVICIIPSFRTSEAREFTREEVQQAGCRVFMVSIHFACGLCGEVREDPDEDLCVECLSFGQADKESL